MPPPRSGASAVWDQTILAQPFDRQPFRQVKIPDWVQNTIGCGYTLSVMDGPGRAAAAAHGVTISEMGFVDPFYAYYDSRLLKKRSPHVPLARIDQEIAEYKRLGVRILAVYPPCLQGEVYETHPEWRRIDTNTTTIPQIDMEKFPHGGMLCLLEKRKNVFDFLQAADSFLNQGKMTTYVGDEPVTFKGPAVRVAPRPGTKVVGTFRPRSAPAGDALPAVVTQTYGKGRVVYFAAGLDAAYYLYAYPYQRLALKHALLWAAASPPPVTIEAPMCVHATLMRQTSPSQDGNERLIVHLFNDLNSTAHHALPQDDVPLREEVIPIHDIQVTFAPHYRFRRVHWEPQGIDLNADAVDSGTRVRVPRLDVHSIIVAELEPDAQNQPGGR
ncbi:MAG: hypothetical protein ACKV0T_06180 [Planctomycetales bacterium]